MATPDAEVRDAVARWTQALAAKDAAAVVACYTGDATAFDLAPPLKQSAAVLHDAAGIQQWFDTWDGPLDLTAHDEAVEVSGGLAAYRCLRRLQGTKLEDGPVLLWYRLSATFRREDDGWRIAHFHESVPFAMDGSGKALLELTPEE